MIIQPIIPIWVMALICVLLLLIKRKGWAYIRQILMVVLLFCINLRPMIPGKSVPVSKESYDLNVLFVVDSTVSMLAEDYGEDKDPRLDAVKTDCEYIVDQLATANFSVITFDNYANELVPYTDNREHVKYVLDSIYPVDTLYAKGSNMSVANDLMEENLSDIVDNNKGKTVVFFISDGEVNHDELEDFTVGNYIDYGAVMGYGTKEGGKMHFKGYYDSEAQLVQYWDEDDNYTAAISKIDEKNLKTIADDLGLSYIHMEKTSDIDAVLTEIKDSATISATEESEERNLTLGAYDLYFVLLIPLLILIVIEMISFVRKKGN